MSLFVNNGVLVNSFPLYPFSMYGWRGAALERVFNELCGPHSGLQLASPGLYIVALRRVVRTPAHVTSYFVVTALVDLIRQRVLIIWDPLYSDLFPKALFCPHNAILIHVSLATKTGCMGEDSIKEDVWAGGTARNMENKD